MKKKREQLFITLAALCILAVGCIVLSLITNTDKKGDNTDDDTTDTESITLFDYTPEDVTTLSYSYDGEINTFYCSDGIWYYNDDADFPLVQSYLTDMANAVSSLSAMRELQDAEELSTYGLDQPEITVVFEAKGNENTVMFGSYSTNSSGYYMNANNHIYTVNSEKIIPFQRNLMNLLPTTGIPALDKVKSFVVNGVTYDDETRVESLKDKFETISNVPVDYKNKEAYGFDGTETKVTVNYSTQTDESTDAFGNTVSSTQIDKVYNASFSCQDNGEWYAMFADDGLIYSANFVDEFMALVQ